MSEVPKFVSKLTNDEWHNAIYLGWRKKRTDVPTSEAIKLLFAMWDLETGGGKGFWNYNFGNMTPGATEAHYTDGYIILNTSEGPMKFASYPNAENGAEDWIRYFSRKGWEPVIAALMAGNVEEFSHLLKIRGYYGNGAESTYTAGLKNRLKNYVQSTTSFEYAKSSSGGSGLLYAGLAGLAVVVLIKKSR